MSALTTKHKAADALDWNEAMQLVERMYKDGMYRDALLVASGCYLGLRISDLLQLRWAELNSDEISLTEKKTGKDRKLRINSELKKFADSCQKELGSPVNSEYIFTAKGKANPMSRQAVDQMLKQIRVRYKVKSAKVFSAHSLRKTFGRRVWLQECDKGRGDQALLLLCDVFGHSSVTITKRYLGIRQEEILSVYDSLTD